VKKNYTPILHKEALAEQEKNLASSRQLNEYLARTGLSNSEIARRLDFPENALENFRNGRYYQDIRSARSLRTSIDDYMRAHPAGERGSVLGELYETSNVRKIRATFLDLLPRPVAYMIYAPPGSQKTFALQNEVARLNQDEAARADGIRALYVYARNAICPRDLMRRIAIAAGSRTDNGIEPMMQSLRYDYLGRRTVLVIDEAQHLSLACLETLRELLDQPPYFSLLLAGSHDLKRTFDQFSATLEQWNSRLVAKVRLPGLEHSEARAIIEREIGALLAAKPKEQAEAIVEKLIVSATTRDAFADNLPYINVRTLTNSLGQIKAQASAPVSEAMVEAEA
jgi:DNA transposition AAA+ family ATPase